MIRALACALLGVLVCVPAAQAAPIAGTVENFDGTAPFNWNPGSTPDSPAGLWRHQVNPESVAVSEAIDPLLVTLPGPAPHRLPAAFSGTGVAWFGDPANGTFCSPVLPPQEPKNGCTGPTQDGSLVSGPFSLGGLTGAHLSFRAWWEVEGVAPSQDPITVEYDLVDGTPQWTQLTFVTTVGLGGRPDQSHSNRGLGAAPDWEPFVVDLKPVIDAAAASPPGTTVQLRIRMHNLDDQYQGFRGLAVDDVEVQDAAPAAHGLIGAEVQCIGADAPPLVVVSGTGIPLGSTVTIEDASATPVPARSGVPSAVRAEVRPDAQLGPGTYTARVTSPAGVERSVPLPSAAVTNCPAPPPPPPPPADPPPAPPPALQPIAPAQAEPPLPPPTVARTANVAVVRGRVRIRLKGSRRFVGLTGGRQIPIGSTIDTKRGAVAVTTASDGQGGTQTAEFSEGVFVLLQRAAAKPVTELRLTGGSFRSCGSAGGASRGPAIAARHRIRRLWGRGRGRFRTRGRYGSSTVRGTNWLTEDRCAGTFFRVREGVVDVRDFVRRRTVRLRAPRTYLARARR